MSSAAISPVDQIHAPDAAGIAPMRHPAVEFAQLAQRQQLFEMLMQGTQSSMISQVMQSPKFDDEDSDD